MINYISILQNSDLKATIQRTSILKSIDTSGHLNIDEIYEDVKKKFPTLSLATIYKNIILMQQHNVIVEVPMSGEKPKFELYKAEHIHLICQKCGTIQDSEMTKERQDALMIENFNVKLSQINLYGLCKNCQ